MALNGKGEYILYKLGGILCAWNNIWMQSIGVKEGNIISAHNIRGRAQYATLLQKAWRYIYFLIRIIYIHDVVFSHDHAVDVRGLCMYFYQGGWICGGFYI